jgi:MarR family transcriptional regulator, temperature-dependent positive regulator of motility
MSKRRDAPSFGEALRGTDTRAADGRHLVPKAHRFPAHLARRFDQICVAALAEFMKCEGIMPREYAALVTVDDLPGLDQRTLATRLGIDAVTAGQMVDHLESMGLVDRRVHPVDRRARVLTLTRRGRSLRQRLRSPAILAQERIMAPLSAAERKLFIDFLVRIIEANESYARPGKGRRRPRRASAESDRGS